MEIPTSIDIAQLGKMLRFPEIRVWCHPHDGEHEDYFMVLGFRDLD